MNLNTTTPVAQYQFSNIELERIKFVYGQYILLSILSEPMKNTLNTDIQTINTILAARTTR